MSFISTCWVKSKLHFSSLNVFIPHVSIVFSIPIDWFTIPSLFSCPFSCYTIWFNVICVYVSFWTFFQNGMQAFCRCLSIAFAHIHTHKLNSYIFQNAENGIRKFSNCRAKKKKRKRRTNYKIDSPYFLPNVRKLVKSVSSTYSKVYSPNAQITSSSFFFFPHPSRLTTFREAAETVIRRMTRRGTARECDRGRMCKLGRREWETKVRRKKSGTTIKFSIYTNLARNNGLFDSPALSLLPSRSHSLQFSL